MFKSILKLFVFISLCASTMHDIKSMNFSRADTILSPKYLPHTIALCLASGVYMGYSLYKSDKKVVTFTELLDQSTSPLCQDDPIIDIFVSRGVEIVNKIRCWDKRAAFSGIVCCMLGGAACIQGVRGLIHYLSNR